MSSNNIYQTNITVSEFDEVALQDGFSPLTKIQKFTLSNGTMEVDIIEYGATITAIRVPDRDGNLADIVLGYDNMKGYMAIANNPYFGATVGRCANRIANGKFTLDKMTYILSKNEGENTLHGGVIGFNRKIWRACIDKEGLVMNLISPHLDQGFPGEVHVAARFVLTRSNNLVIRYKVRTDRPTIINLASHGYFNLAGHDTGSVGLYEHNLMINATNFTPNDDNNIPKGKIQDVLDTVLDFTTSKNVGEAIEKTGDANGFDVNFCVNGQGGKNLVACLEHPPSGRRMVVHSNQPGVQLYTGNCVEVKPGRGKGGVGYSRHAGLCLETQNYPNAINEKHFPSCILRPPDEHVHIVCYQFSTFEEEKKVIEVDPSAETNSLNLETDHDFDIDDSQSRKSDKRDCQRQTDPPECQEKVIYPDFTTGRNSCETSSLNYEPMSSLFSGGDELNMESPFAVELKNCQDFISFFTRNQRFKTITPGNKSNSRYNIITDTDLTPSVQTFD